MAETNAALASLMARPESAQNYVSIADAMRNRALSQQQIAASQTGQQLTQQQIEAARLENQQRQMEIENTQHQMDYFAHPEKYEEEEIPKSPIPETGEPQGVPMMSAMNGTPPVAGSVPQAPAKVNFAEQMLGLDPSDPLAKQANGMIRARVMPQSIIAYAQGLMKFRADALKQSADKLAITKDQLEQLNQGLVPIAAEPDPAKRAQMLTEAEPMLQKASEFDPSIHQAIMQADPQHMDSILTLTKGMQDVLEYGIKQEQAKAEKLKTEAPDDSHRKDAIATIQSYPAVPDAMKAGFAEEIKNAPTIAQLEKIQDRADKASESFQRSADARQQAETMADIEKRKAVQLLAVKDDQDLTKSLANTAGIRGQLDMSKGGNQQATQDALVRFAEHEVVEGGIKRFNETELKALGSGVGSAWRNLEAWYQKGAKGKLPEATYSEIGKILDFEDEQSRSLHDQSITTLGNRMGVNLGGNQPTGMIFARDPQGKLHQAPAGTALPKGWTLGK